MLMESSNIIKSENANSVTENKLQNLLLTSSPFVFWQQATEYWIDACQRYVLFLDVLRQRSNTHLSHEKNESPTVLHFEYQVVLDGRRFVNPVNYQLLKILPPEGTVTDRSKRPFIVFDPRAGHGPGIGGMKEDSEIGSTMRAGHPCYFVGFLPHPEPTQTVEHVCEAEAIFVSKVIEMHPEAEKPCLIGNCQAGWQIAMMSSLYPELVGVLILAGAPMSYWSGVRGRNPMRYRGGLLGGSWTAALCSDTGHGLFDGAFLVQNFENMNPANTYWKKAHNLYAKIDTEAPRFLEFERWWGSPILLNGVEMQFIADGLFVGNKFSTGQICTSDGLRMDLRNIKTPIVVFCSQADDITPPQQALGWILDMYRSENEIVAAGQTIIYCLHQSIGHLGIFVSSSVASKEHDKFIKNIDLIETLPPGLYEAVFIEKTDNMPHAALASGRHVLRFESRKLEDIRKLGCNDDEDERRFATVARISDNVKGIYETFFSPYIRSLSNERSATFIRDTHPIRVRYRMFSDKNPFLMGLHQLAENVKKSRKPVSPNNIFWQFQEMVSDQIVATLNAYRDLRDYTAEKFFLEFYGSPFLQAAIGLRTSQPYMKRQTQRDVDRERDIQRRIHGLMELANVGGLPEAMIRALLYMVRGGNGLDEREFNMLKQICNESHTLPKMTQAAFKSIVRNQHSLLVLDERASMEAISRMLDATTEDAEKEALAAIRRAIEAHGEPTLEERRRLNHLKNYFTSSHTSLHRRASDIQIFREFDSA